MIVYYGYKHTGRLKEDCFDNIGTGGNDEV